MLRRNTPTALGHYRPTHLGASRLQVYNPRFLDRPRAYQCRTSGDSASCIFDRWRTGTTRGSPVERLKTWHDNVVEPSGLSVATYQSGGPSAGLSCGAEIAIGVVVPVAVILTVLPVPHHFTAQKEKGIRRKSNCRANIPHYSVETKVGR